MNTKNNPNQHKGANILFIKNNNKLKTCLFLAAFFVVSLTVQHAALVAQAQAFQQLPSNVTRHIVSYLDLQSAVKLRQVSKPMKKIVDELPLSRYLLPKAVAGEVGKQGKGLLERAFKHDKFNEQDITSLLNLDWSYDKGKQSVLYWNKGEPFDELNDIEKKASLLQFASEMSDEGASQVKLWNLLKNDQNNLWKLMYKPDYSLNEESDFDGNATPGIAPLAVNLIKNLHRNKKSVEMEQLINQVPENNLQYILPHLDAEIICEMSFCMQRKALDYLSEEGFNQLVYTSTQEVKHFDTSMSSRDREFETVKSFSIENLKKLGVNVAKVLETLDKKQLKKLYRQGFPVNKEKFPELEQLEQLSVNEKRALEKYGNFQDDSESNESTDSDEASDD